MKQDPLYDDGALINISFNSNSLEGRVLSNFFTSPFILYGINYLSIEGFLHSLRYNEGDEERQALASSKGPDAKNFSRKAPLKNGDITTFQNTEYIIGSPEYHKLVKMALREKFIQNPVILKVLLSTIGKPIQHILTRNDGSIVPDSINLPRDIFCNILEDLREEHKDNPSITEVTALDDALLVSRSRVHLIDRIKFTVLDILESGDSDLSDTNTGIREVLKGRDEENIRMLRNRDIHLDELLGMYGEITLNTSEIACLSQELQDFLLDNFTNRVSKRKIHSRGLKYYFNLPGLYVERKERKSEENTLHAIKDKETYNIVPEEYFGELLRYYNDITKHLDQFSGRTISELSEVERKTLLLLLDHLRNLLLFFKGQSIIFKDFENFSRSVSKNGSNSRGDIIDQIGNSDMFDIPLISCEGDISLDNAIYGTLESYFKTILGEDEGVKLDFSSSMFSPETLVRGLSGKYQQILENYGNSTKFISRFILNTLRVSREADNPIKTLYSCINFYASKQEQLEECHDLQTVGMMYGGIEVPYILKYLLSKVSPELGANNTIDFMVQPMYGLRSSRPVQTKPHDLSSRNIILVDDNICNGKTIIHAKGLLTSHADKFFLMAVDVGNDVNEVSTSVLNTISGFLPIKDGFKGYANSFTLYLRRRGIIGKT